MYTNACELWPFCGGILNCVYWTRVWLYFIFEAKFNSMLIYSDQLDDRSNMVVILTCKIR